MRAPAYESQHGSNPQIKNYIDALYLTVLQRKRGVFASSFQADGRRDPLVRAARWFASL